MAGSGGVVLVLNSGSSSVKFALLAPDTGERVLDGLAEKVGTPEAVLRIRRSGGDAVEEPLPEGSYQAVISRVLDQLVGAGARDAGLADAGRRPLIGAGHRVVHGGDRFSASVLVDDEVLAAIRSFAHLAPLQNPANLAGIEAVTGLERLDALVFTGGIGENSPVVRGLVLRHLGFLGLTEDPEANAGHGRSTGGRISRPGPVQALVVPTDEELMIARDTARLVAARPGDPART